VKVSKWEQRIRRADELAAAHPFASEILRFYKHIASLQKLLYGYVEEKSDSKNERTAASLLRNNPELDLVLPEFPEFLSGVAKVAPQPISQVASDLRTKGSERWRELLTSNWQVASEFQSGQVEALLAWTFLQPYAEYLAEHTVPPPRTDAVAICPACARKPTVGVLRPEGDGAKRSLICSMCATEWAYRRIVCPACGEESAEKLAIYTASQFEHVRVEACETCHNYVKTVDLTKNGHAVPIVDELATIPLNLWAQERQYVKLQANLFGL